MNEKHTPGLWTTPHYVLLYGRGYYRGGHPHLPGSWSPCLADAKRYDRNTIHNMREYLSANTSGPERVMWEHERLAPADLSTWPPRIAA